MSTNIPFFLELTLCDCTLAPRVGGLIKFFVKINFSAGILSAAPVLWSPPPPCIYFYIRTVFFLNIFHPPKQFFVPYKDKITYFPFLKKDPPNTIPFFFNLLFLPPCCTKAQVNLGISCTGIIWVQKRRVWIMVRKCTLLPSLI